MMRSLNDSRELQDLIKLLYAVLKMGVKRRLSPTLLHPTLEICFALVVALHVRCK
jgi:hypothetical protein